MRPTVAQLKAFLAAGPRLKRYLVAFSGGLDSTVLLHLAARALPRRRLLVVHVDHGLHADSADWASHCKAVAAGYQLAFREVRVTVDGGPGGIEAGARAARYRALADLLSPQSAVLTAQHTDDQLETFLLQAMRGAGPAGLAAMPVWSRLEPGWLARPLLNAGREDLEAVARAANLDWLNDPANAESRFDRNYLRHAVLPPLRERWPHAAEAVARSARHCASAQTVAEAATAADYVAARRGPCLDAERLAGLPRARQTALLRFWVDRRKLPALPEEQARQVLDELLPAGPDAEPCVRWPGAELRRYRDALYALPPLPDVPAGRTWPELGRELDLGDLGRLRGREEQGGLRLPANAAVTVGCRQGGEVLQPAGRPHHKPLKQWFQEAGVPPWVRRRWPLVFVAGELAAVPGLWVAEGFAAGADETGWHLDWQAPKALDFIHD